MSQLSFNSNALQTYHTLTHMNATARALIK